MAVPLRSFVLGFCIFLAFEQVANCAYISCYSCAACSSDKNSWSTSTNSSTGSIWCYKYVYVALSGLISYTDRGISNSCSAGTGSTGGTTYCCTTDYCNGSVSLSSSLSLVFALVAGVGVLKRMIINY